MGLFEPLIERPGTGVYGFTGTSRGLTGRQRKALQHLYHRLGLKELHHGDCVEGDATAHAEARRYGGVWIVVHPPTDGKLRAYCEGDEILPERPYLVRNRAIVMAGVDGLIACPYGDTHPASLRGQGTWTTVGYARRAKRKVWFVFRDGTIREDV